MIKLVLVGLAFYSIWFLGIGSGTLFLTLSFKEFCDILKNSVPWLSAIAMVSGVVMIGLIAKLKR